uniref:Beta-1,3-galactosyl-O-glycosyl-glycoprotein beta-1,6-N-acetylglucosaminyltransferase 4-like n=1 Tax=Denticeps clupeoides TaxID=299321 RepID=A0AAY4EQP1_9TELE
MKRRFHSPRLMTSILSPLFTLCGIILLCLKVTVDINETYHLTNTHGHSFPVIEEHGINCSAIYDLDPVEIGKSLRARKTSAYDGNDISLINATLDCGLYVESRGYTRVPVSNVERDFPLAYSLVVHKDAPVVERMLRAVYTPNNIYCIHYDLKSSNSFTAAIKGLARCLPNVFIASKLEAVQYAGISRVMADLHCLSDLMQSKVKWKYAINLCGQDFPLRSNFELVMELKGLKGANMMETSRPTKVKEQRYTYKHLLKDEKLQYFFIPRRTNELKSPPPHDIKMYVGSAYFVISREFVKFIQTSSVVKDFLAWSEDTFSPDEHFWATVTRIPGAPGAIPRFNPDVTDLMSKARLVKWHYLEGPVYPPCTGTHVRSVCIYGAAELRWLLNFGSWFANKVDPRVDPVLHECLEMTLRCRTQTLK